TLIGAETGIKTIAAVHSQCRRWVKDRRTRRERKSSAAFSITDDLLHRNILLLRASSGHVAQMLFSPTSRFWAAPPGGNGCLITELSRFSDSVRDLRYPIIRLITRLSESLTTFRAPARILHN